MPKDKDNKKEKEAEKLNDFNIEINEFGEIITNTPVEKLNDFLNKNLEDKKLKNSDLEEE